MTMVTCPIQRYHPAVVAQMAATVQPLSRDRFTLGLGAGENLNEHILDGTWQSVDLRDERLAEALKIITGLYAGETVTHHGQHFVVDSARCGTCQKTSPSGSGGLWHALVSPCRRAPADLMIATTPNPELVSTFQANGGAGRSVSGQLPISFDADPAKAVARAHEQFRWSGLGWKVNSELPGPSAFAAATQNVRPEDLQPAIPCGSAVHAVVEAAGAYANAGFSHLALVQIGGAERAFLDWAEDKLLPELATAFGD